jgi:hypothetical protein
MVPLSRMNSLRPVLIICMASLAACSKPGPKHGANGTDGAAGPQRSWSESLGFAPDGDYTQGTARPTPAAQPAQPAKPAPSGSPFDPAPPPPRVLTAKDGRKLEAFLVARNASAVKVRRAADGVEFTIPLDKLSDADQAVVRKSDLPLLAP